MNEILREHPGGDHVRRVSKGGVKGYVRMTAAEISEHEHWQTVLLPLKQDRRERERRAKGIAPQKELLSDAVKRDLEKRKLAREDKSVRKDQAR